MDTDQLFIPAEMRQRYLERRYQDAAACDSKLQNLDWVYFEKLGHQLKGNAASYGYAELGSIASKIETSAVNKNLTQLEGYVQSFRQWIQLQQSN